MGPFTGSRSSESFFSTSQCRRLPLRQKRSPCLQTISLRKTLTRRFWSTISGFRYYNPSLQRWVSRDPLGEPAFDRLARSGADIRGDGPNLYWFVHNSPISQTDPMGLSFWRDPPSGVKYCEEPGFGGHVWLEFPGGSIGFWPGTGGHPLWPGGIGTIESPDRHAGDPDKRCQDVPLSGCYDKQKFQDCIKNQAKQPPGWYCVIGSNCGDWADAAIRRCKGEARN
jgi:RHS repeat-associated protein